MTDPDCDEEENALIVVDEEERPQPIPMPSSSSSLPRGTGVLSFLPSELKKLSSHASSSRDRCSWCHTAELSDGGGGAAELRDGGRAFCSERCFTLSRRAAFKKSKVCDWCRKAVGAEDKEFITLKDKDTVFNFCK